MKSLAIAPEISENRLTLRGLPDSVRKSAIRKLVRNDSSPSELSFPNHRGSNEEFIAGSTTEFESTLGSKKKAQNPRRSFKARLTK